MTAVTVSIPDFWVGVVVGAVAAVASLLTVAWRLKDR